MADRLLFHIAFGLMFARIQSRIWAKRNSFLSIEPSINSCASRPLNTPALAALKKLRSNGSQVFAFKGYKHWFDKAVANAKIDDFTWYSLRHSFASRLVMAGVDIRTVAELMGHQTIQTTMRYAHLAPANGLAAVQML